MRPRARGFRLEFKLVLDDEAEDVAKDLDVQAGAARVVSACREAARKQGHHGRLRAFELQAGERFPLRLRFLVSQTVKPPHARCGEEAFEKGRGHPPSAVSLCTLRQQEIASIPDGHPVYVVPQTDNPALFAT